MMREDWVNEVTMASSVSSMSFVLDLLAGGPMDWTGIDWFEEADFSVCTD